MPVRAAPAVLAPPSLAGGDRPVAQVGYPPLAFMDPQLLRGEGGRWSDIWALGATVHQVVTGSAPFPGIEEVPVVQALSRLLMAAAPALGDAAGAGADLVATLPGCRPCRSARRPPVMWPTASTKRPQVVIRAAV